MLCSNILARKPLLYPIIIFIAISGFFAFEVHAQGSDGIEPLQLRVGYTDHHPSTYIDENGNLTGIYVEVIEYMAEQENWELTFVPGAFSDLFTMLENGEVDIVLNMAFSEERLKIFKFNNEDVFNSWAEVVTRKDADIHSIPDLRDLRIAGIRNATFVEGPQGIRNINDWFQLYLEIIPLPNNDDVLSAVRDGRADAGIISRLGAEGLADHYDLKRSGIVFSPVQVRFGIYKGHPSGKFIANAIDKHLLEIKNDAESIYFTAFDRHLGILADIAPVIPRWIKWFVLSASVMFVVFAGNFIFLNWKVRKKTDALTKANIELEQSTKMLKETQDAVSIGSYIMDIPSGVWVCTETIDNLFEIDEDYSKDISGWQSIVHPDDRERVLEYFNQTVIVDHKPFDIEYRIIGSRNKKEKWVHGLGELQFNTEGSPYRLIGTIQDISARKKSEAIQNVHYKIIDATLKSSSLIDLLASIHSGINQLMDAQNFFVALYDNKSEKYSFPYFSDENDNFELNVPVSLHKGFTDIVRKNKKPLHFDNKKIQAIIIEPEIEIIGTVPVSWIGAPLLRDDAPIGVVVVQSYTNPQAYSEEDLDVLYHISGQIALAVERKISEEELEDSRQKMIFHLENTPLGFIEWDLDGKVVSWNKAAEEIFGYNVEEAFGQNPKDIIVPYEHHAKLDITWSNLLEQSGNYKLLDENNTKNGKRIICEWYNTPLLNNEGEVVGVVSAVQDVTETKKMEQENLELQNQLYQVQKMESIGRLAGGIAHDFNNVLTGIMGYAELLKLKFPTSETPEGEAASVIIKGAERAAHLTKQLLGFARGGKYNPRALNINSEIKEVFQVSEKIFEKNISVKYEFDENISTIEADKNQLDQIFTNLIINARDAMPGGGKLVVSTKNCQSNSEHFLRHQDLKDDNFVKITVCDSGIGMPENVRVKVFEPFYTTKGEGEGTGLGLATVYGIVKNHGGYIFVESESGQGTTFSIFFPSSMEEVDSVKKSAKTISGEATILVIDDEETIRTLAKVSLEYLGYTILTADSGMRGIDIYRSRKADIDLVLLDMIMPKMSGKETNLELHKIDPDVIVLLTSGYSQDGQATQILDEGASDFIQKPFSREEISNKINKILSMS